ncbi:PCMD domain-containing protein [Bacteroides propionicifaciens]|uniref:PCMD domain-containing protein n=1 Tax=Bacteroides propionicifaciens TaxID=392838 RepID=UPI000368E52F|nr:PCMD domain-containing protein [Bacteroides propionicifaciens]
MTTGVSAQRVLGDTLANERVEMIAYGDMNQWITRRITESAIIGGKTKDVYAIGPTEVITGDIPYVNKGGSPWATSNVMAKVAGVTKTNTSVFPDRRGTGFSARMDTRMESVKVFGLIDITVLAAGSVFLGSVHEPIKSTKNPQKILQFGVPFTKKPRAVRYDYKIKLSGEPDRIRATGFGRTKTIKGKDLPATVLLLQKRWEDEKGNVFAKRVGTMVNYYYDDTEWIDNATYQIMYGDIASNRYYLEDRMKIQDQDRYTVNSKGDIVLIQEIGWANADEAPTHIILQFSSSHGGAYIGSPGNTFWVDNVKLVY